MKMKSAITWITLLAFVLAMIPAIMVQAGGQVYYISTGGNDGNPGTQISPFKTVQKCLNVVKPGDTCEIAFGTYYEALTLKTSGVLGSPITLRGNATINSGAGKTLVTSGNINYYIMDGLRLISTGTGANNVDTSISFAYNYWGDGQFGDKGNDGFILRNCYIEGAVYFYGSNNLVENCELNGMNKWMNGLIERSHPSENNIFRNNKIHHYTQRGGWTLQLTYNSLWEGNTVYDNGMYGIDCDGAGNPVHFCKVKNNLIHDITGDGYGIELENAFDGEVSGNEVYNVVSGISIINYGLTGSFTISTEYRNQDTRIIVSNNYIHDTIRDGIIGRSAPGVTVTNNIFVRTNYQTTAYFGAIGLSRNYDYYCTNWTITGNKISNSQTAVWVEWLLNSPINLTLDNNTYDFKSNDSKYKWRTYTARTTFTDANYSISQMRSLGYETNSKTSDVTLPTSTATEKPTPTFTMTATQKPTFTYTPTPTKTSTPSPTPECKVVIFSDGTIITVCK